jgi:hypothetical protein
MASGGVYQWTLWTTELHIARAEGDGDEQVYQAACELARMCGVDVER